MRKNQTIGNNQTGETLTMLVSDEENGGVLQIYRVHLPPHRPSPPLHYHVAFTETFTVLEGTLDMYPGKERRHVLLKPGESVTAQIGQPDRFANHADAPSLMTVETKAAGGVVKAFQLAYAVANDGGAGKDELPRNPFVRLRFIEVSQGFLPTIPPWAQRTVFRLAAFLAMVKGVENRLKDYQLD